jgi:diacylglycerol O-acyltransferase / wax synthase
MAQQHFDRLSAVDASFLHQEGADSHMHVGAVTIVEGPPPPFEELLDALRSRLHLVPRYRQKLAFPRFESGRPLWVDDPSFNLEYHVRQSALPDPGSEEQLRNLTARIFSQRLDRSRPLWEMWLIENLEPAAGGAARFALISKTHHALIDGISGVDLATVIFDLSPVPPEPPHPDEAWSPHPEPSTAEVLASGALSAVRRGLGLATRAVGVVAKPGAAAAALGEAAEGVGEIVWAGLNPAPPTPLNVPIGPHRRYVSVAAELRDFKLVKDVFGGTVNDVVLTVVSGALREWLRARGTRTEGLELRALVPVSIRTPAEQGTLGNRIAVMRGPLPVYIEDPIARLRTVKQSMDGLKESKQAVGAEVLAGVQSFAPPTVLAQASRLNFSTRLFNLIVTNVPGPQFPIYVRGREMQSIFPVAFLPQNHALAVAIMSYNGGMNFGLLGDYDALPDIQDIADGIEVALAELVALAKRRSGRGATEPAAKANGGAPGRRGRRPGTAVPVSP